MFSAMLLVLCFCTPCVHVYVFYSPYFFISVSFLSSLLFLILLSVLFVLTSYSVLNVSSLQSASPRTGIPSHALSKQRKG